ncbi:MAG: hypothetical protein ABJA57_04280 [Ginsengibacter sp.]
MKQILFFQISLLLSVSSYSQEKNHVSYAAADATVQLSSSDLKPGPRKELQGKKLKNKLPFPASLTTMENTKIAGLITDINDSSVILIAEKKINRNNAHSREINFSDIMEIKLRKKHHFLNSLGIGAGVGLLPVIGGIIIGKGEGAAIVSVFTFPVGIITGGIVGASRKKFGINGNAESFYQFKKRMN